MSDNTPTKFPIKDEKGIQIGTATLDPNGILSCTLETESKEAAEVWKKIVGPNPMYSLGYSCGAVIATESKEQ